MGGPPKSKMIAADRALRMAGRVPGHGIANGRCRAQWDQEGSDV